MTARGLIVDSFAGGGGASLGISWALGRGPDIAVNHDPEAVAMHAANHPETRHYCESVWTVDPVEVCAGRPVALAWFSPDCKHFSKAKGGKPVEKGIRSLAWVVVRWARAVKPRVICLENVEEFQDWGPLNRNNKPDARRRGFTFRRWVGQLRGCGYQVEWRELRARDYGAPTSRKRLFLVARSDGLPITWPEPTHGPGRLPYRTAAECIDWSIPCPSIFERSRPLAEATLRRIARGIRKFVLDSPSPFIVEYHASTSPNGDRVQTTCGPLPTQTTANRFGLVEPFVVPVSHQGDERAHSLREPLRTVTGAHRGELGLVAPALIQTSYGERKGQAPRSLDLFEPLGTVVAGGGKHALVAAFLAKHYGNGVTGSPASEPIGTVTSVDHHSLVTSHLLKLRGGLDDHGVTGQDHRRPAPTVTAGGTHLAEVRAFLIQYYGSEHGNPQLGLPLGTATTHDRFGLVTIEGQGYADRRHRPAHALAPRARARPGIPGLLPARPRPGWSAALEDGAGARDRQLRLPADGRGDRPGAVRARRERRGGRVIWSRSHRADPAAASLADRHYSRRTIGSPQFVPPGRCLVLLAAGGAAVWVTSWPLGEYVRHRWPGAWVCSLFRRESGPRASDMIRDAVAATRWRWPDVPPLGLVTFIDPTRVRPAMVRGTPVYGWTWVRAGFEADGETQGGLLAFRMRPERMPPPGSAAWRATLAHGGRVTWRILESDARSVIATLPAESVQCCVTSPPYWNLRDYGVAGQLGLERTPKEYVAGMVEVFREVRRVLRSDGTLWLTLGDCYAGSWGAQGRRAPAPPLAPQPNATKPPGSSAQLSLLGPETFR